MFRSASASLLLEITFLNVVCFQTAHYIVSDIYIYSCINIRPLFMAKMCALISDQKDKTLLMLFNILVQGDLGR